MKVTEAVLFWNMTVEIAAPQMSLLIRQRDLVTLKARFPQLLLLAPEIHLFPVSSTWVKSCLQLRNVIEDLCSDKHLAGASAGIKVQFGSGAARNRALSLGGDKPQLSFLSFCFTPKSLSVHLHWLISQLTKIKCYGISSEQNCAIIFYHKH